MELWKSINPVDSNLGIGMGRERGNSLLVPLGSTKHPEDLGGKGRNLQTLKGFGYSVPYTLVIPTYALGKGTRSEVLNEISTELVRLIDPEGRYSVRSSASIEDSLESSYAGQFLTVLDVTGVDQILDAIEKVWNSMESEMVERYRASIGDQGDLEMAVLIQDFIEPSLSGVSFSRNPVTGLNEIVVEAIEGRGDRLVQKGMSPMRWVDRGGHFILCPEEDKFRDVIGEVAKATREIDSLHGSPVDLEWVFDGERIHWLQMRDITAFRNLNIYSNHISREFLPGIIKPLIWSINVPLVNGAWLKLFRQLSGHVDLEPEDLARQFYHRAYFNMGAIGEIFHSMGFPRDSIEMLMGLDYAGRPRFQISPTTIRLLPKWMGFALDKLTFGARIDSELPEIEQSLRKIAEVDLSGKDVRNLVESVEELSRINEDLAFFNVVTPLLSSFYVQLLKGQMERKGLEFKGVQISDEDLEEFDPTVHLEEMGRRFADLSPESRKGLLEEGIEYLDHCHDCSELRMMLEDFIRRFGHFSESGNDFSSVPWREDPSMVLNIVTQQPDRRKGALRSTPPVSSPLLGWMGKRASEFRVRKERISSLYTYGYGLFRPFFIEIGKRFVEENRIREVDDIFYLTNQEIRDAVGGDDSLESLVNERREEINSVRDVEIPDLIFGEVPPPPQRYEGGDLKGTPTSGGYYEGRVRTLHTIRDMDKVRKGDVLVIPYSDVAWTPLFSGAGAILSESGGFLSHSSIIAREYGIPAVVSVNGVMKLEDDTLVMVDGYNGLVRIRS